MNDNNSASNRRKSLKVSQLRSFISVAKNNGFAGAAAALGLSAPSVWQQLRALEAELNVPLVEVNKQRVTLTKEGAFLIELAEPVLKSLDSIRDTFTDQVQSLPQRLSVAAPSHLLAKDLAGCISLYRDRHPDVGLTLIDCPTKPAMEMLESGHVDLAIVGQLSDDSHGVFSGDALSAYPFILAGPLDHKLQSKEELLLEDFAEQRMVMASPGTNARERVNEVLKSAGVLSKVEIALEASSKELLMRYVQMNMGIAVAPMSGDVLLEKNRRLEDRGLFFRDVSNLFGYEYMKILRRDSRQEPEHQKRFREMVLLSSRI